MPKAIAAAAPLQPISGENSGPRLLIGFPRRRTRRRITRPFTALPVGYLAKLPLLLQPMFHLLWEMNQGQSVTACYELLALRLGRSYRTAQEHTYALERLGVLKIRRRKVSPCRNLPNVFSFPELEGFIELQSYAENCVPDPERVNTTPQRLPVKPEAEAKPGPAYSRSRENHPPEIRHRWEHNTRYLQRSRQHRPDPSIGCGDRPEGYYAGEITPLSPEELALRARLDAADRAARARFIQS